MEFLLQALMYGTEVRGEGDCELERQGTLFMTMKGILKELTFESSE
jgi:hypothetical protein